MMDALRVIRYCRHQVSLNPPRQHTPHPHSPTHVLLTTGCPPSGRCSPRAPVGLVEGVGKRPTCQSSIITHARHHPSRCEHHQRPWLPTLPACASIQPDTQSQHSAHHHHPVHDGQTSTTHPPSNNTPTPNPQPPYLALVVGQNPAPHPQEEASHPRERPERHRPVANGATPNAQRAWRALAALFVRIIGACVCGK